MKTSRLLLFAGVALGVAGALAPGGEKAAAPKVELKSVKYDALKAAVRDQRGKVVVVDIWASTCGTCIKDFFPHMLDMQRRYEKDGLVCLSVSVDEPKNRNAALKELQELHATIANYWIDEKEEFWQDKFDTGGPPAMFVFDRQGKRAAKFDNDNPDKPFKPADVEKVVQQLLKTP